MPVTDPRVDTYIDRAAPFAKPILEAARAAVHAACPSVEETIKWSMPFFTVDGRMLAHMAAFKQHCTFRFWRARGTEAVDDVQGDEASGPFGRLVSVSDLPTRREFVKTVKHAIAALAAAEADALAAPVGAKPRAAKPPPVVPDVLAVALRSNAAARTTFDKLPASHRREYIDWIEEAKRDETRTRRVAQAIEWLAEGKSRNWKYEAC